MKSRLAYRLAVFLSALTTIACETSLPNPPDETTFVWNTYDNEPLGYSLDYPSVCEVRKQGDDVRFDLDGELLFRVAFTTDELAGRRGLWDISEPDGAIQMGGRAGHKFVYPHQDIFVWQWRTAYRVDHRGKAIAIEFASDGEPSDLQDYIVNSFRFD